MYFCLLIIISTISGVVLNIDPKTNLAEAFNITIPPNTIAIDESYLLA